MSSYESLTFYCSSHEEEEYEENDTDEGYDGNQAQNLSGEEDENGLSMYQPNLSIQREGEEEFGHGKELITGDSETEVGGYYSFNYYGSDNESGGKMRKKEEEEEDGDVIGRRGLMVITRPKGGRRSLCMDMCEVKACHELGFDLEHQRMLQIPSRLSLSTSTLDSPTSGSGTDSPISNWRISSPGDDPRDVKARLKLWAQAVAVASASNSKHPN